jgi:hypothetical protein
MPAQSVDPASEAAEAEEIADKVLFDVSEWIDTETIARSILSELQWQGFKPTAENAKAVWLSILSDFGDILQQGVKYASDLEE